MSEVHTPPKVQAAIQKLNELLEPSKRVNRSIRFKSIDGHAFLNHAPEVKCKDGFSVSVQASHYHYCTPRDSTGPWTTVELGFPSHRVPSLREYRDGDGPDMETVFGYVPIKKVAALLVRHGGIAPAAIAKAKHSENENG